MQRERDIVTKTRMHNIVGLLLALALCLGIGAPIAGAQDDPRTMQFDTVQFIPPEPERVVLDNGMVVYLLEDHELPLVTITAMMQTGAWLDPADQVGLA
ncbi:MAG: hypothetical protein KGJ14_12660, partial [Nitrospirota bacterium]|nr:hypothetical protein [Nitrospirota bacterium]